MEQQSGTDKPASVQLQRLGAAAAEDLRATVRGGLNDILGRFLQQLPGQLADASNKAAAPVDRSALTELARTLPANAPRWIEAFAQQVDAQLIGGAQKPAAAESAGGDDSIAVAGVELRAEERYSKLVTELDARFNRVRLMLYVPVYPKALAPAGLCRALQETADAMKWPVRQRRLLLEKFDSIVVPDLERFYRTLIEAMTRIGVTVAEAAAKGETPAPAPRKVAPKVSQSPTTMQPPADPKLLDADSLAMLQALALKSDGSGYTDGLLAADLMALADSKPLPGVTEDQSWIPMQRISLAGHFLNIVISDAMVPEELRPQHESVRFPLMKSALTDDTLFTSVSHPLGSLIHEMLLKSATSRVTGNTETRRMAELLQQVLVQFDLAPEFVRQAMKTSSPIQQSQIQRFYELQRQQAQQRRDFVITEAKRVVVRELEQATFGREIPATALRFLNQAWGPLLTKRLLQHGAASAQWKAALKLMELLLDQVEQRNPEHQPSAEWRELLQQMGQALVNEGMAADKVKELVGALEAARQTPVAAAAG